MLSSLLIGQSLLEEFSAQNCCNQLVYNFCCCCCCCCYCYYYEVFMHLQESNPLVCSLWDRLLSCSTQHGLTKTTGLYISYRANSEIGAEPLIPKFAYKMSAILKGKCHQQQEWKCSKQNCVTIIWLLINQGLQAVIDPGHYIHRTLCTFTPSRQDNFCHNCILQYFVILGIYGYMQGLQTSSASQVPTPRSQFPGELGGMAEMNKLVAVRKQRRENVRQYHSGSRPSTGARNLSRMRWKYTFNLICVVAYVFDTDLNPWNYITRKNCVKNQIVSWRSPVHGFVTYYFRGS